MSKPALLTLPVLGAVAAVLLLAGCSAVSAPAPTASTPLRPGYPKNLTRATATSETEHYAKVIGALVPSADVKSVSNDTQFMPATSSGGAYFAEISTITLNSATHALADAAAIRKQLVAAGWISHATAKESNQYLSALASSKDKKTAWFLELGANTVSGQAPSVTVQIGSPDLPGS